MILREIAFATARAGELTFIGVASAEAVCGKRVAPGGIDRAVTEVAPVVAPIASAIAHLGIRKAPRIVAAAEAYRVAELDQTLVATCPPGEISAVVDSLPVATVLSDLSIAVSEATNYVRGQYGALKAAARGVLRAGCRKLFGALGKWIGAGIGALFSPAVGMIVGAAVGIAAGCAVAWLIVRRV